MKASKIFIIAILSILTINAHAQLCFNNRTNRPVSVAVGWISVTDSFSGFKTKGWYIVEPGETISTEFKVSDETVFFYYAKGEVDENGKFLYWSGDFKLLVSFLEDKFTIKNANMQYVEDNNFGYEWVKFVKHTVHIGFLDSNRCTIILQ